VKGGSDVAATVQDDDVPADRCCLDRVLHAVALARTVRCRDSDRTEWLECYRDFTPPIRARRPAIPFALKAVVA
jgi:hypothetical protein